MAEALYLIIVHMVSIILFVLALIIRLVSADQSFWLDEGASIFFARLPIFSFFTSIIGDFHPPLYYLLLHFWLPLAGRTEWLIRLPNVVFGAFCVPILFLLLKEVLEKEKKRFALLGALLLMINPLHIYYSAELRMYSVNALLSLLSWLFLIKAVKSKDKDRSSWISFTIFTVLNLYTFYGSFFNLFSQAVLVFWQYKKKIRPFMVCTLISGLIFLPWLPTLAKQLSGGGYLTKILPGWSQLSGNLSPKSLGLIMAKFTIGRISLANKGAYAVFVAGVSLYFLLCSYLASLSKEGKIFLVWFYISLLAAIFVSIWSPVLGFWRYVFLLPAFVSIITIGLSNLPPSAVSLNLIVVFLVFTLGNAIFLTTPSLHREDWRAAAQLIAKDNSISVVNFPDVFAPLRYYAPGVYFYADQISLGKMRPDLDQSFPLVLKGRTTIFVFDYLSDLTDKRRSIMIWLKEAGYKLNQTHDISGVGFIYEFVAPI